MIIVAANLLLGVTGDAHGVVSAGGPNGVGSSYGQPHRKDPQVVGAREEALTALWALLLRRAELIRVRAEHAAVTFARSERRPAARAGVEVLARVLGHRLSTPSPALRTGDRGDRRYHCISGLWGA
jgi:hypothetical protein